MPRIFAIENFMLHFNDFYPVRSESQNLVLAVSIFTEENGGIKQHETGSAQTLNPESGDFFFFQVFRSPIVNVLV